MSDTPCSAEVEGVCVRYGGYLDISLRNGMIAAKALPGQFIMLKGHDGLSPILGRPFDIADADPERGTFRVVVKVRGAGTELLRQLPPDAEIPVLGPLGKGVEIASRKQVGLLARGVGAAAVTLLAKRARQAGVKVVVFLSANTARRLVCLDDFEETGCEVFVATDDGSAGYHGNATDLLSDYIRQHPLEAVYTCGSRRFARFVDTLDAGGKTAGFVFMEGYMACGLGNCHGCAVKRRNNEGYLLVCKDGPVFPVSEVVLE